MVDLAISTVAQGLMWSILAIGVFLSFRVLDVPDMTCEGSFPLGGAIAASMIAAGVSPWAGLAAGALGGLIAGVVTGVLYTKLKIPAILAGILTMIALYSINLHVMGKANISLLRADTVFSTTSEMLYISMSAAGFVVSLIMMAVIIGFIYWFFGTELGMCIRATGFNPQMVRAQGVNTDTMTIIGLFISNALIGLCGAVVAQNNGFADVGMGIGTIVIGLASVIIGEVILGADSFSASLAAVVLGSILYRVVIAGVLYLGMPPNDLKLFTAIIVMLALAAPMIKDKVNMGKAG
ncbi:MAG: ABC transporter permease [Veillonellaceae bacterium]|uniref:ABC transporter permease n=1 Tax=Dialister hominis TaxID=2582419 RepID=UPI0024C75F96|nr:MAG: ABC transporter permease [Veillonellaceae bacterium]